MFSESVKQSYGNRENINHCFPAFISQRKMVCCSKTDGAKKVCTEREGDREGGRGGGEREREREPLSFTLVINKPPKVLISNEPHWS